MSPGDDDAQCDAREHVRVVTLPRVERLPVVRHWAERAAARKDTLPLKMR